jgi:hypothetical protein
MTKMILLMIFAVAAAGAQNAAPTPDAQKKLDQAKAASDRAMKRKEAAEKKAAEAEAAYRKLQGRREPTDAEANELLRLFNANQSAMIALNVTLPQQVEKQRKQLEAELDKTSKAYQEKLAALKAATNATNCAGLNPEQRWADCKVEPAGDPPRK